MLFICYVLESQDDVDSLSRESVASDEISLYNYTRDIFVTMWQCNWCFFISLK